MTASDTASLVILEGSRYIALTHTHPDATFMGDPGDDHPVRLLVMLKPRTPFVQPVPILSRADYIERHAAREDIIERVSELATQAGLTVERADAPAQLVVLTGALSKARTLFHPEHIGLYQVGKRQCLGRHGGISVPHELASEIVAVMGYDERPVARTHFRRIKADGVAPRASGTSYTPPQVAAHYGFPGTTTGGSSGIGAHFRRADATPLAQTIALIELGGGYKTEQMAQYFSALKVDRTGKLVAVPVAGGSNTPEGNPDGADGEVQLDIEVAGSVAPAADIAVYFAPNQNTGFLEAITTATHDTANAPDIMSISWGGPESSWSTQDMTAMDQAFQSAAALGITVCVASGDSGADDGTSTPTADFPASSPHVLACGGTSLPKSGPEVAWNDGAEGGATGGGYSTQFAKPNWQAGNTQSMRGVPDVSGNADPQTGYQVTVDGQSTVIGGTSAVAPLWAALIALCNARSGKKAGLVAPVLYASTQDLNDITSGDNNGYEAASGWDPVTGLGSPKGTAIAATLSGASAQA